MITKKFGGPLTKKDLKDDPDLVTPTFDPYEDDKTHGQRIPDVDDQDEDVPDTYNQYVGATVREMADAYIKHGSNRGC